MNFDAAIFDLDGTLLDSMDVWADIDSAFLQKRRLSVPKDYAARVSSLSFRETAQYTIDLFGLSEKPEEIMKEWDSMAAFEYAHNVTLFPGTLDYLLRLKRKGVRLAVATALREKLYVSCLKNNSVYELFDVFCSTDEVAHGKEHPDVFDLTAKKLGISPQRCLVFDDVLPAIKSAKQAGMLTCMICDKASLKQQAEAQKLADFCLTDWKNAPLP